MVEGLTSIPASGSVHEVPECHDVHLKREIHGQSSGAAESNAHDAHAQTVQTCRLRSYI